MYMYDRGATEPFEDIYGIVARLEGGRTHIGFIPVGDKWYRPFAPWGNEGETATASKIQLKFADGAEIPEGFTKIEDGVHEIAGITGVTIPSHPYDHKKQTPVRFVSGHIHLHHKDGTYKLSNVLAWKQVEDPNYKPIISVLAVELTELEVKTYRKRQEKYSRAKIPNPTTYSCGVNASQEPLADTGSTETQEL